MSLLVLCNVSPLPFVPLTVCPLVVASPVQPLRGNRQIFIWLFFEQRSTTPETAENNELKNRSHSGICRLCISPAIPLRQFKKTLVG